MRTRAIVAAAVILLAAALGAGWWWHQRATPGAPASAGKPAAATGATDGKRAGRDRELGAAPRVVIDDDPAGTLRLEGQVIDADDHGVAGATVVVAANPPRTATTDASGGFGFDGLLGRPYTLIARAASGVAGPLTTRLTAKSDPVVLRLHAAAKLTVSVVTADGKPVDGATVELRGFDVQRARTAAGSAAIAPVVPGNYQIAAWADGLAHSFQRMQIGRADASARLVLMAGAPVSGRVVDDRGDGIAGAHVRYSGASDFRQQASERYDAVTTGGDGGFAFAALPAGSFRFVASHPERAQASSPLVTLDGKAARTGVTITMAVGATVTGRVVDSQKQPVASARIRINASADGRGPEPREAYSDASGHFELKGLPRKPLQAVALHELGSSQLTAVDASAGDVKDVTLTLALTGKIAGKVVDPTGQPIEGAQILAGPTLDAATGAPAAGFDPTQLRLRGLPQATSDAGGRFELTGLVPGTYRVVATPGTRPAGFGNFRGRPDADDQTIAKTGDDNVKLVVAPDGSVTGRVAFADGTIPDVFVVDAPGVQQSFGGNGGKFQLDGLAPGSYELEVRGANFQTRAVEVAIAPARTADAGTITVVQGRTIAGTVVAAGQPVANATVYAGRSLFGSGTTTQTQVPALAALGGNTKQTTTDANGAFSLSGFGDGDVTVIAEQDAVGRSRALRLPSVAPGQTTLTLTLEKFAAIYGVLTQAGQPAEGVAVTCQSTTSPGAVFTVVAGADGSYRFDRLAPDSYKVSATLGTIRTGMRFYAKQADVPAGGGLEVDLSVNDGTVTLNATLTAGGPVGMALLWLSSVPVSAATESSLALQVAAAGPGTYQRLAARAGSATLTNVAPGAYTLCATALPLQVQGLAVLDYVDQHGSVLAAVCQPITVAPAPTTQAVQLPVTVPAMLDGPGGGSAGH